MHRAARARDEGTESLGVGGNGKGALNEELDSDLDLLREQQVSCVFLLVSRGPVSVSGPECTEFGLIGVDPSFSARASHQHARARSHSRAHTHISVHQEMISQMCKLKAAAYLAHERERSAEEQRQEEQLALMRLEQLQVYVCVCVCVRARARFPYFVLASV